MAELRLTQAEQTLIEKAGRGEYADFRSWDEALDDPSQGADWGPERTLRAEVVHDLCTGEGSNWPVHARGVRVVGARIEGRLDFSHADLRRPLFLLACHIEEPIQFDHARTKSIALNGSRLPGFSADGLEVKGGLFLKGVKARGEVRLLGAKIHGQLDCEDASFDNPKGDCFVAEGAEIAGSLLWRKLTHRPVGTVSLGHAKIGRLVDDSESWPERGNLMLDGFVYGALAGPETPVSAEERIDWLERQPETNYWPQPYEQLIRVFRAMGHDRDARKIAIAKQKAFLKRGQGSCREKLWIRFLGVTIGYGYKAWRAIFPILVAVAVGTWVFSMADSDHLMVPSKERVYLDDCYKSEEICKGWREEPEGTRLPDEYPAFQPFVYSLGVFLPIVELHQEEFWQPVSDKGGNWFFRIYFWFHILIGWMFTTVAVVGLTGLVKKD